MSVFCSVTTTIKVCKQDSSRNLFAEPQGDTLYFVVQASIKIWQSWLSSNVGGQAATPNDMDRRQRKRQSTEQAIKFWQDWLEEQHSIWDDHEELTFLLPPSQKTLPDAQYKQSVPLPHGMSKAEVQSVCVFSLHINAVTLSLRTLLFAETFPCILLELFVWSRCGCWNALLLARKTAIRPRHSGLVIRPAGQRRPETADEAGLWKTSAWALMFASKQTRPLSIGKPALSWARC